MDTWFWKVRIYTAAGPYGVTEVETPRDLESIKLIQKFYLAMTGGKMLIEGMSDNSYGLTPLNEVFKSLWERKL